MKIIVLTPVKNEDWILERFLSVTSVFADHIIILDQNSTDDSVAIAKKYPKVTLLHNKDTNYDEASRQLLLIQKARALVSGPKILLALDADEILTADSIHNKGWQTMLNGKPGTILYFEKPDLYLSPYRAIRYDTLWPLGYIDDDVAHVPTAIHSIRIPQPSYADKLYLHDVKIMHYALNRPNSQISKMRFYSMVENTLNTNYFWARRRVYKKNFDYVNSNRLELTPNTWFEKWEQLGIDMKSIQSKNKFWYDEEALKLFVKHGSKKFWLDNIWDTDWNTIAKECKVDVHIKKPPLFLRLMLKTTDKMYQYLKG